MKILQLTSNDPETGGAIAVTRLNEALRKQGHDSRILNFARAPFKNITERTEPSLLWRGLDAIARRISYYMALPEAFRPSIHISWRSINGFRPDLIHLHWAYVGFIPIFKLPSLTRRYPLIWTFHDMWPFTGGCTNSIDCVRWRSGCGACPQLDSSSSFTTIPSMRKDKTAYAWKMKQRAYSHSRFLVVAPSRWMAQLARNSPMLNPDSIHHVPNCLDTHFWKPLEKKACKMALNISPEKKVLLFIGKPDNLFAYPGRREMLEQTLRELKKIYSQLVRKMVVVLVGKKGRSFELDGFDIIPMETVTSAAMMRICHNAADVLFDPTLFDNLPCIIQEAMSCGTPVIASNVGGISDLVQHMETGYLCHPNSPREFADGISFLLTDQRTWTCLSQNARQKAVNEYDDQIIYERMIIIYTEENANYAKIQSLS